jgi:hypothetical protein
MYYYTTPNYSVALNAKVGSSTMARLIIKEFYPKEHQKIVYARFPNGITENQKQWHWMCPGSTTPDKPIVLMVRNPVDRFITACQQIAIKFEDVDKAIDSLVNDSPFLRTVEENNMYSIGIQSSQLDAIEKKNSKKLEIRQSRIDQGLPVRDFKRFGYLRDDVHFLHQHEYIQHDTYLFKFPESLKECLEFIGINNEPITINKAKREKPALSEDQRLKIESYYKKDMDLFNSIDRPGQLTFKGDEQCH